MNLCSIGELARQLGVAIITLRRWHRAGSLVPAGRTPGGHRRYDLHAARQRLGLSSAQPRRTIAYARVSSHDQKEQLATQAERLRRHCHAQGWTTEVIQDLGWVRLREPLRFSGKILNATVSLQAGRWFVSVAVDCDTPRPQLPRENQALVGVDLGVKQLATLSTGDVVQGPKALGMLLGRLQRLSRSLSRKVKGSSNRSKAKARLARLHMRIGNIRKDALHKLTTTLATGYRTIVIEDLNVKGMLRNRHLARAIADRGFGEFRRQLEYKALLHGSSVLVASTWFPSSKLCSSCGTKNEALKMAQRNWQCGACGATHDRDINAAKNLQSLAVSSTVTAPGEKGSGKRNYSLVKPVSTKGEDSRESA